MTHEVPNRVNTGCNEKNEDEYQKRENKFSMAGQIYPIAAMPSCIEGFKPGTENMYVGKGTQYLMTYGQYCVAMNCQSKSITFDIPKDFVGAKVLSEVSNSPVKSKY